MLATIIIIIIIIIIITIIFSHSVHCSTTDVTKVMVCTVLSAANQGVLAAHKVVTVGFSISLSLSLVINGCCHKTINKMC